MKLVQLPTTYNNGKLIQAGSARTVVQTNGKFSVVVTLADRSEYRVYEDLDNSKRADIRTQDINLIEE